MDEKELTRLEEAATEEIERAIYKLIVDEGGKVNDVQPPSSVIRLAAEAAAKVLIGFERGYRMGGNDGH